MSSHAHRQTILGLAVSLALILSSACKPKEQAPEFINKSAQGQTNQGKPSQQPSLVHRSRIELEWIQAAVPEAVVRTGSEQGNLYLPETTGAGIAVMDFDRDGQIDIVCAGGGYADNPNRAMRGNRGSIHRGIGNARFMHVSDEACMDLSKRYSAGLGVGDYDCDGFLDVFVTGYNGGQLLRNQGDGTFETLDGLSIGLDDRRWGASVAFFDGDNDGLADLYVANYADWSFDNNPVCGQEARSGKTQKSSDYCGPREFKGLPDVLYRNLGDGRFENISAQAGIEDNLRGLGVLAADLDHDGDVDLYVSNDVDPNLLYRNDGDFKFTEVARRSGVATNDAGTPEGSMGIAFGDYNLDGIEDLWVTNYQNELNALYRNNGNLLFNYASINARIAATDQATVGWGTAFADMDCDGDEDLIVVNGHIELKPLGSTYDQRPQILENIAGKSFQLLATDSTYLNTPQSSRGLAMADLNQDGKLDFITSRVNTDAAVVLNKTPGGKSLRIRLVGTTSNRDALGARIRLEIGTLKSVRQVVGGGSYASANDLLIHFGIPENHSWPAKVEVYWPSGKSEQWSLSGSDREWVLVEGQSTK
ncbi:MAG: CRTAC1 family protein [Planctomycetota bacterium]|jgi:hypothetical protein